jgi:hypothetical protein
VRLPRTIRGGSRNREPAPRRFTAGRRIESSGHGWGSARRLGEFHAGARDALMEQGAAPERLSARAKGEAEGAGNRSASRAEIRGLGEPPWEHREPAEEHGNRDEHAMGGTERAGESARRREDAGDGRYGGARPGNSAREMEMGWAQGIWTSARA